ncbi:DUF2490 domain-containing protein [Flavobacteriaceae bacterium F89]|uniref:DUF2490 domain-containing protein n=1 Tax=Cerina litoralis TaxID=2874477 RepID=A0AAE3EUD3_9FLAO|nr:DUF2490 domain-containing protein [Cerina litoralis]MCG2460518.1 DUF2490 domain-containing protein [Cerina litoralis]
MVSRIKPIKWVLCILLWGIVLDSYAQEDSDFTQQLWASFNPSYKLTEKKQIKGDLGYRTISPPSWNRLIARGGLEVVTDGLILKNFKKIKTQENYTYGAGMFYLNSDTGSNSFEIRPYQGYRVSFNVSNRLAFGQYIRLEERFVFSKSSGNVFGVRLRYQILGNINLEGLIFQEGTGIYFPIGVEFFFNIRKTSQFNDVLRVSPGIGYQINPGFKIQGGIAYHYTQDEAGEVAKSNDFIYQFKLFKTLNFGKKAPSVEPDQPPGETNFQEL